MLGQIFAILLLVIGCLTLLPSASFGQERPEVRVLFLGNSSYAAGGGCATPFAGYCSAAGISCEALHTYDVTSGTPKERRISPWLQNVAQDARIRKVLQTQKFDYVVLWTRHPAVEDEHLDKTLSGLHILTKLIASSGATPVMPMSYTPVDQLDQVDAAENGFRKLLKEASKMHAEKPPTPIIYVPLGRFWKIGVDKFGAKAWFSDRVHGTPLAQYATGCLFYTFLLDRDPRNVAFNLLSGRKVTEKDRVLEPEVVTWIQDAVWKLWSTSQK